VLLLLENSWETFAAALEAQRKIPKQAASWIRGFIS